MDDESFQVRGEMNSLCAQSTVLELKKIWGERLPDHDEYLHAANRNDIRVDKTIAALAFEGPIEGVSKKAANTFGLLLWVRFLITPATFVFWMTTDLSIWYIPLAYILSKVFLGALRESHCQYLISAACKDPQLYDWLINNGAFLFHPEKNTAEG
jgi:hypothetical protein